MYYYTINPPISTRMNEVVLYLEFAEPSDHSIPELVNVTYEFMPGS